MHSCWKKGIQNNGKSMFFLLLFRKRENVKMAASCRRERQNGGLKGSEKRQKTVPKQCRKTHGILMHIGSENLTKNEPKCCQKTFKKLMKKPLKTASTNRGQTYRKMEPKGRQRRPKTPTSCRQNPDMEPGTPPDAKKEGKRSQNGAKRKPKESLNLVKMHQKWSLKGHAKPREAAQRCGRRTDT